MNASDTYARTMTTRERPVKVYDTDPRAALRVVWCADCDGCGVVPDYEGALNMRCERCAGVGRVRTSGKVTTRSGGHVVG